VWVEGTPKGGEMIDTDPTRPFPLPEVGTGVRILFFFSSSSSCSFSFSLAKFSRVSYAGFASDCSSS
jgi:hypothetical protein